MFSLTIHYAWLTAQAVIFSSLLLPAMLYVAYCVKKAIQKTLPESEETPEEKDYAIIVSVTGETKHLQALFHSLQQLSYTNYLVYVVMNEGNQNILPFPQDKIVVLRPAKPFTDAARIHRYAIENFRRPHTHVAILNSNSIPDTEYLNELNVFFNQGYQGVQGFFTRKKYRTVFDVIHALTHSYNRFFYGEVPFALGSFARLDASGGAFTVSVYKQYLKSANKAGTSLSRALQYVLASKGYEIAFAPKAVLYNQHSMHLQPLVRQHANGINGWFRQFACNLNLCLEGINTLSFNRFLFGLLLLQPPVLTSFLSGIFCLLIAMRINPAEATIWIVCLVVFLSYFMIAQVQLRTNHQVRKLLSGTPRPASYLIPGLYEAGTEEQYNIAT